MHKLNIFNAIIGYFNITFLSKKKKKRKKKPTLCKDRIL